MNPQNHSTVIGIDLGTTTTEAAVYRNGKPEMILNFDGQMVTPSAVGVDESGNFIIGEKARAQYIMAPERTVIEVKRKMGTSESLRLGRQFFSPVELSSMLLDYVKRYASQYLEEAVTRAVISVPAYFDDIQRQAVVEAGEKAGFTVERIINEPTAAALSYGISHMEEESHILVYDLGGGTFDVTLLEMFGGVLEVKASSGNNTLGGKDFDQQLITWLQTRFEEKSGISLKGNTYALARLKEQAEQCKIALSTQEEVRIQIPLLAEKDGIPQGLEETVTRSQFEDLIRELVEQTHDPIDTVLGDSGIRAEDLDLILLVGGSTRIPLISRDIEAFLGMEPKTEVDPDYSVAQGAAIQAAIISGEIDSEEGIVITDVNPYTLGIRALYGFDADHMSVVIPRNVTIPVRRHQVYSTSWEGQEAAQIDIYQGESRTASSNHFLGTFTVNEIPYGPAGREQIDVSFAYDLNGLLQVSAQIVSTGKEASVSINLMEQGTEPVVDVSGWKDAPFAGDYRSIIRRSEKLLKKLKGNPEDEEDLDLVRELEDRIYQLKKAILEEDLDLAEDLEEDIRDLMEEAEA